MKYTKLLRATLQRDLAAPCPPPPPDKCCWPDTHPQCKYFEPRWLVQANGARVPRYQCTRCGEVRSPPGFKKEMMPAGAKDVDQKLRDETWQNYSIFDSINRGQPKDSWRPDHPHYRSESWRRIRRKRIEMACGLCEGCGENPATQVHHLTYRNFTREFLFELRAVCDFCHDRIHGRA